ncbi:MFS general substrate transporter [Stipitochalara longipes BDJ]|nr:MFS general substrate transporter [Stipitochalara longipes BDJ]
MRSFFSAKIPYDEVEAATERSPDGADKEFGVKNQDVPTDSDTDADEISLDAQPGVQNIEAITKVWSKTHLVIAYIMIWCIYFLNSIEQSSTGALTPYVTSAFQLHSLTAATSIMSSIIGGLVQLPLAKVLDIWGRPQGYALMVFFLTMGLVMMAACKNVETYAAAQVFYWVGYNGLNYCLSIFIADTSSLKNRGLMFGFTSSPYIITVWCGGPIAQSFLATSGFRWAFGMWAILTPVFTMPLWCLFMWNYRKAEKAGLILARQSNRTTLESLKYYFIEFDVIGLFFIAGGLALFLLPFSLYSYQANGWRSALVVSMIVIGGLMLIAFGLYEKYLAPKTFIPWGLLTDRTVMGACILAATLFVEFYIWDSYFSSFLQVVNNLSVTKASYVVNIYSIGSCFWAVVVGVLIRHTGRFKWLALCFGVPITILGVGLMVKFRQPDTNVGFLVMCQIFIAFGGGTLVICEEIAVMAATSHQYIAAVLAVEGMFANVGGAIGSTVAGAIWTGTFPNKLAEYLPADAQANLTDIYESLDVQISYEWGSETRNAIAHAYGDSQRYMLIAATAILILALLSVAAWRDIQVKDYKQTKGRVV